MENHQALFQTIKQDILQKLQLKELKPGDRLPTESELMEQYNVSRITASRALNELRNEGIIIRYPGKGTFVANKPEPILPLQTASSGSVSGTSASLTEIAFILPTIQDYFSLSLINGLKSVFSPDQYRLYLFSSQNDKSEDQILKRCLEIGISGIVLFPVDQAYYSDQLLYMKINSYPLVLIDRILPGIDTSYVITDNYKAGQLAMNHLHQLGHRNFAFFTKTHQSTVPVQNRIQGIQNEMENNANSASNLRIYERFDIEKPLSYYYELMTMLIRHDRITAIIVSESAACLYLYDLITSLGYKIPQDISLLSFDNPISAVSDFNFFTHINQSEYALSQEAGQILKRMIQKKDFTVQRKVLTPVLEIHNSTGLVPVK